MAEEQIAALSDAGLGALAGEVAEARRALSEAHELFRALVADRVVRFAVTLRGFAASGVWDIWAPNGNDAPRFFGGFDVQLGIYLLDRLLIAVGPTIFGPVSGDSPAFEGLPSSSSGFGLDGELSLRLADWDSLDAFSLGASAQWTPLGVVTVNEQVQRDVSMLAVGPALGYETCLDTETRIHVCLLTELAVMATWQRSKRVIATAPGADAESLAAALRADDQTDRGWQFGLRFGLRFAL